MTHGNTPEGTADTALSIDDAAHQLTGLLDDDPEPETVAPEDTDDDEDEADEAETEADDEAEEEAEAEDPEDDADDGDDDDEPEPSLTDETEVELEDGSKVTLADLKKGNLRQADYTRKTQELAEIRKGVETKDSQLDGAVKDVIQKFEVLEKFLSETAVQPPSPGDWENDPLGAPRRQAEWMQSQQRLAQINQQLSELRQYEQQQQQAKKAERLAEGRRELLAWKPEVKDPQKAQAWASKLLKAGAPYGFNDLNEIEDVRILKALDDLAAYQDIKEKMPKAKEKARKAPPVTKPQQRQSSRGAEARRVKKGLEQLRKSGSAEDAAKLLINIV